MRYTVVWTRAAQGRLADLWLRAADRRAVTRAAHQIDQTLGNDPDTKGFPYGGRRLLHIPPLRVFFEVRHGDMMAEVFDVW